MPKRQRKVAISWTCDVCHQEHETKEGAIACENKGLALPEFKKLDLVRIALKDGRVVIGQIVGYGPDEGHQDPHLLPGLYDVNITYRDYNPRNYLPRDNNPLMMLGHPECPRDIMKLYIADGPACSICQSTDLQRAIEEFYAPYCCMPLAAGDCLDDVEVCRCGDCGLRFFNKEQSESVNQKIRAKLKGVKVADTKKLIKRGEVQHS